MPHCSLELCVSAVAPGFILGLDDLLDKRNEIEFCFLWPGDRARMREPALIGGSSRGNQIQLCSHCWEFFYEEREIRTDLSSFVSVASLICFSRAKYPLLYLCGISSKMKRKQHSFGLILYNQNEYISFSLETQNPSN